MPKVQIIISVSQHVRDQAKTTGMGYREIFLQGLTSVMGRTVYNGIATPSFDPSDPNQLREALSKKPVKRRGILDPEALRYKSCANFKSKRCPMNCVGCPEYRQGQPEQEQDQPPKPS